MKNDILASLRQEHPRLLAFPTTWEELREKRGHDAVFDGFLKRGEAEARALLDAPPLEYQKTGRRLLHVSRAVLRRVLLLGLHFHLTGDARLARRAQGEMLAAAAFVDWNPSHFLDSAEMTAALAFGYDWLWHQLDAPSREIIKTAIVEKGLRPGLVHNHWLRHENNWNQVCLGGLSLGALALAEDEPELAAQIGQQTKDCNTFGLKPYAPDGVYPEGASYWGYGTSFQVVLLSALQSALGTDWGLSQSPGFRQSADALTQTIGPSGQSFNFSDGSERQGLEPALWWFAHTFKQPHLLSNNWEQMKLYATSTLPTAPESEGNRLLPLVSLWWPEATTVEATTVPALPRPLSWYGRGPNPLATFRNAWDDGQAMFLALKGGKATLSHAHMDAGSFVFEAQGVRWARDLGMQDYHSLESRGIDLWGRKQDGERWKIFRLGPFSHSTLTINEQLHRADGDATITHFSAREDRGAIVDLAPVFAGQAGQVKRGFAFRAQSHVLIRDEIEGLKAGDVVRWAMLTRAEITINDNGLEAVLSENGRQLRVQLRSSIEAKWETISAEPPNDFDALNPGARLLIVRLTAPQSGHLDWSVMLQPQPFQPIEDTLAQTDLAFWPQAPTVKDAGAA